MKKIKMAITLMILERYGWKIFGHPGIHLKKTFSFHGLSIIQPGDNSMFSFQEAWDHEFKDSFAKWFFLSVDKMLPLIFIIGFDIGLFCISDQFRGVPIGWLLLVLGIVNFGLFKIPINAIIQWKKLQK